jgi:predicted ATP-dependent Lon-type protease
VSKIGFTNPDEMAGKLKDFMVDGFFYLTFFLAIR